jgi:predicted Zn-dependent peptidase
MHRIGRSELTMGEVPSLDWVVEQVEAVTSDDVSRVIERVLGDGVRTLALVGPPDTLDR